MIKTLFIIPMIALAVQTSPQNPLALKWKTIRGGFTEQQVRTILGEPKDKESSPKLSVWYYQDCPVRDGDRVIDRPKKGTVVFRLNKTGQLAVTDSYEPDWSKIEYITPMTIVPSQPVQSMPKPVTVSPPVVSKPVAKQIPPLTPNTQPRVQSLQSTTQDMSKTESQKTADPGSRYFIYCGAAFIAIALIVAISQGSKLFR